jgi:hypothetical protein
VGVGALEGHIHGEVPHKPGRIPLAAGVRYLGHSGVHPLSPASTDSKGTGRHTHITLRQPQSRPRAWLGGLLGWAHGWCLCLAVTQPARVGAHPPAQPSNPGHWRTNRCKTACSPRGTEVDHEGSQRTTLRSGRRLRKSCGACLPPHSSNPPTPPPNSLPPTPGAGERGEAPRKHPLCKWKDERMVQGSMHKQGAACARKVSSVAPQLEIQNGAHTPQPTQSAPSPSHRKHHLCCHLHHLRPHQRLRDRRLRHQHPQAWRARWQGAPPLGRAGTGPKGA